MSFGKGSQCWMSKCILVSRNYHTSCHGQLSSRQLHIEYKVSLLFWLLQLPLFPTVFPLKSTAILKSEIGCLRHRKQMDKQVHLIYYTKRHSQVREVIHMIVRAGPLKQVKKKQVWHKETQSFCRKKNWWELLPGGLQGDWGGLLQTNTFWLTCSCVYTHTLRLTNQK